MDPQHGSERRSRILAVLLLFLAGLVALAGLWATLAVWGLMATYADDTPNTWLQNATPLLVYTLPSWACAIALAAAARRLRRGSARG